MGVRSSEHSEVETAAVDVHGHDAAGVFQAQQPLGPLLGVAPDTPVAEPISLQLFGAPLSPVEVEHVAVHGQRQRHAHQPLGGARRALVVAALQGVCWI